MVEAKSRERVEEVLGILPVRMREEIKRVCRSRRGGLSQIREIRVRRFGVSSLLHGHEHIFLFYRPSGEEIEGIVTRLCDGGLYAHRDSISSGYIPMSGGVRVGVCGVARYEYKSVIGVSEMSSLVFRIPGHECAFGEELYRIFCDGVGSGMLIYSPPGVGKTTALRSLAAYLGTRGRRRVAVVDERCEFLPEDYADAEVDLLRGYKRRAGLEIATRTMSPDVVMIDELGGDDAASVIGVVRCGIPLVATAHAASYGELLSKASLAPLLDMGAFDVFVGISSTDGVYRLTVDRK